MTETYPREKRKGLPSKGMPFLFFDNPIMFLESFEFLKYQKSSLAHARDISSVWISTLSTLDNSR